MRICLIKPHKAVGSETFIQKHIDMLQSDHDVDVLYGSPLPTHSEADGPLLAPPTLLQRARRSFFRRIMKVDQEYFLKGAIMRRAHQKRYDVVMAECGQMGAGVAALCRRLDLPLVVHFHGYDAYQLSHLQEYAEAYRLMFDYATAIIVVSTDMQRQLEQLGCARQKLCLKPYGVDVPSEDGMEQDKVGKTVLAVGRFVDKKAPHITLLAFSHVLASCPSASLVMIGAGPLLGACKTLAESLGITERVDFRGAVPNSEVKKAMCAATVFAQHSVVAADGDSEGTPVAILEASSMALTVVATRHTGIQEAVLDGETGFLVDEGDIQGMAARISELLQDNELCQSMGMAGRRHIKTCYSSDLEKQKLNEIVCNAANKK